MINDCIFFEESVLNISVLYFCIFGVGVGANDGKVISGCVAEGKSCPSQKFHHDKKQYISGGSI